MKRAKTTPFSEFKLKELAKMIKEYREKGSKEKTVEKICKENNISTFDFYYRALPLEPVFIKVRLLSKGLKGANKLIPSNRLLKLFDDINELKTVLSPCEFYTIKKEKET